MKAPTLETLPMYCHEVGNCLLWAHGTNGDGYPQASIGSRTVMVRRWVYTELMGGSLERRQPVVTRCTQKLCVSPSCLFATTLAAVLRRQYRQGRRGTPQEYRSRLKAAIASGMATLTPQQVEEIRALPPDVSHVEAARRYGVTPKTISAIRRGASWRHQALASSVFTWRPPP